MKSIRLILFLHFNLFLILGICYSQEYILPAFIDDITSCDIDLDGDEDIICICQILNYDEDSIFIFYNDGDGVFQRVGYHYPNSGFILCGCMDGNEFPDLITRLSYNVFYIPNDGLEGFGEPIIIDDDMGANMSLTSDINNDDWIDLIFNDNLNENWGIYKNINGSIFTKEIIQSGSSITTPGVGLLNNDSLPDIVLSYSAFDRSSVNINNGNFIFTEQIVEDNFNYDNPIMNLDNSETEDFALVNYATNKISLFKYIGETQFELQANFFASGMYGISSFLVDDFNQDGYDDFAITRCNWYECTDSLYLYFNDHNWSFYLNQCRYIGGLDYFKLNSSDLNGDSYPDIFMKGCNGNNVLKILWNDGTGLIIDENPVKIEEIDSDLLNVEIFPNPFSSETKIEFGPNNSNVKLLQISDINGKIWKSYEMNRLSYKQEHSRIWDGSDENGNKCPSGVYIILIASDSFHIAKKVIKY